MTLSKFLARAANQEIPAGTVLWLDEAGLTGTKHMAHLLRIAKGKGCRVVLAGDTSQHTAVARGDALRLLIQRADLTAASVSTIVRQNAADYREAVQQLAQGKTDPESPERGLRILQRRGSILTYPDALDRFGEAAKKIASLVAAQESHLAIAPTHHEIATLTTAVRQELSARGLIQMETAREIPVLRERCLTSVEKRAAFLYQVGDVIELNQRVTWGERGHRFTVAHVDNDRVTIRDERGHQSSLSLDDAEKFQIAACR
jgi:ATP-dependent exoDNAse (exonuclease V) alpha subunit